MNLLPIENLPVRTQQQTVRSPRAARKKPVIYYTEFDAVPLSTCALGTGRRQNSPQVNIFYEKTSSELPARDDVNVRHVTELAKQQFRSKLEHEN